MLYTVKCTETYEQVEKIEAENEDEAISKMKKRITSNMKLKMIDRKFTAKVTSMISMEQIKTAIIQVFCFFDNVMGEELSKDAEFCDNVSETVKRKEQLIESNYSMEEILEWAIKMEARKKLFGWY